MKAYLFTEAINCGKITAVALRSFFKHNSHTVHVYGLDEDFKEMGDIAFHPDVRLINCSDDMRLRQLYLHGHEGTAYLFAKALCQDCTEDVVMHFDGDVVFKANIIEKAISWLHDYDIFGSRRCYKNNPAGIPVDPSLPDTISTYFFGIRKEAVPVYEFEYFRRMCAGSVNPLGHPVFDFFDPVTFVAIKKGASINFVDQNIIGGQNEAGSKVNSYRSNLHLDMGSHIAHFGGVGSGYSYYKDKANQNASYGQWALGRYALFTKLFYDQDIGYDVPPQYGADNRWINGGFDNDILNLVKKDLANV